MAYKRRLKHLRKDHKYVKNVFEVHVSLEPFQKRISNAFILLINKLFAFN